MAVIIDMKIPKSCADCPICHPKGKDEPWNYCCFVTMANIDISMWDKSRPNFCPLKEVPTGKWIRKYDSIINSYYWQCNQCEHDNEHKSNYCPNCGSRMVEEQTGKKTDDNA